jgi:hypothetical protein
MTTTRKPWLTRRRVIAAVVLLVTVLAVAGLVFGVFDPKPSEPVIVTFLDFAKSKYGGLDVAVVRVENLSKQSGSHRYVGPYGTVIGGFLDGSNSPVAITITNATFVTQTVAMAPESQMTRSVLLPQNGARVRLSVEFFLAEKPVPGLLEKLRRRWQRVFPPKNRRHFAVCEQEIQCPILRPDGTVEPPRLVSKEHKAP